MIGSGLVAGDRLAVGRERADAVRRTTCVAASDIEAAKDRPDKRGGSVPVGWLFPGTGCFVLVHGLAGGALDAGAIGGRLNVAGKGGEGKDGGEKSGHGLTSVRPHHQRATARAFRRPKPCR